MTEILLSHIIHFGPFSSSSLTTTFTMQFTVPYHEERVEIHASQQSVLHLRYFEEYS